MKKLILIDDHAMLREGIAFWITNHSDWQVVCQAGDIKGVNNILNTFMFNDDDIVIAIVDVSFKTESDFYERNYGFEIIKKLNKKNIKSIVFSSHDSGGYVEKAMSMEVGAWGYVAKTSDEETLLEAVNTVASGKTFIQPNLISQLLEVKNILAVLTQKEKQVAELISIHYNNDEVAAKMGISTRTVENYLTHLYDKTGTMNKKALLEKLGKI